MYARWPTLVLASKVPISSSQKKDRGAITRLLRAHLASVPATKHLILKGAGFNDKSNIVCTFDTFTEGPGLSVNKTLMDNQVQIATYMQSRCCINRTDRHPPIVFVPSQVKPVSALRISMVPTRDYDGRTYSEKELLEELQSNRLLKDLNFHIAPHFACNPTKLPTLEHAPVEFQFFDNKGEIRNNLLLPRRRTIYMFGSPFRLSIPPIRPAFSQCTRCQALGHTSTGCKAPVKCEFCAEHHASHRHRASCRACIDSGATDDVPCNHPRFCANCSENHAATSVECPLRKKYARPISDESEASSDDMEEDL